MRRVCWSDNTVDNFVFVPHNFPYSACCCLHNLKIIQSINFKWAFVALESSKTIYWIVLFFSKNFVRVSQYEICIRSQNWKGQWHQGCEPTDTHTAGGSISQLWRTWKQFLLYSNHVLWFSNSPIHRRIHEAFTHMHRNQIQQCVLSRVNAAYICWCVMCL